MIRAGSSRRRRAGLALGALALISAALAVWAEMTGGFRIHVLGVPVSVRGESRAAVLALLFGLGSFHLLNGWHSRAIARVVGFLPRTAPWIAAAAAIAVLILTLSNLSPIAGGSDSSGYLSQAQLWMTGHLRVRHPEVGAVPWPESAWTFSPLGYRPDAARQTIVPFYAPGLPILMAAATLVAGSCGPYLISPICAALLVWVTYAIGSRLTSAWVGVVAAVAVAVSPTVLFLSIQPMSDVPCAAFWTLSLFFAGRHRTRSNAVLAGVMAGVAILIRPNLVPLAVIPAALLIVVPADQRGSRWRLVPTALFAAGCLPFVAIIAATFNHLYGSPLRSGYPLDEMHGWSNAALNLSVYPRSLLDTQGIAAFAFLLAPLVAFVDRGERRVRRILYFLFIVAVFGCYLFYLSYAEWWYLRFLLPAFPFVFVLGADAISILAARAGSVARHLAVGVFAAFVIFRGFTESSVRQVLRETEAERRYADAAAYVQTALPSGAVVLAFQHSGSLAYYSDKVPLRYDIVPVDHIDGATEHFRARGRPVYILLDDWEIPVFAERFRGRRIEAAIQAQPLAVTMDGRVKLFAAEPLSRPGLPERMPRTLGCLPPAAGNLYSR